MINYREIRNSLIDEIENEKGFTFKKLFKIIQLNGILKDMQ